MRKQTGRFGWLFLLSALSLGACDSCHRHRRLPLGDGGEFGSSDADAPAPDAPTLARAEICNNGIDDDLNGVLDDGCVCSPGATQPCYAGWPEYAGIGVCSRGVQTCMASGSVGRWARCEDSVLPSAEICGDGLDNDCDGLFDEDCPCEESATRSCFPGTASQLGVGPCAAGVTTCAVQSVFEGTTTLGWGPCVGAVGPRDEVCDGVDDDCDGTPDDIAEICDLIDNDCDGDIDEGDACAVLPGLFALSRFWPPTGSGVLPARAPLFALVAAPPVESSPCSADQVLLAQVPGMYRCVPEPPSDCADGTHYDWVGDAWACVPCELLVQFGGLYAYERTCAPKPRITCPAGEVPTFTIDGRIWECIPECNNGQYDRAYQDGSLVCIPC